MSRGLKAFRFYKGQTANALDLASLLDPTDPYGRAILETQLPGPDHVSWYELQGMTLEEVWSLGVQRFGWRSTPAQDLSSRESAKFVKALQS